MFLFNSRQGLSILSQGWTRWRETVTLSLPNIHTWMVLSAFFMPRYTVYEGSTMLTFTGYPLHRENRGKGQKECLSGKTQEIWKFGQNIGKIQRIRFAQVVNSLILKAKDIAIFAAKISNFDRIWISLPSQFYVRYSHTSPKPAQE